MNYLNLIRYKNLLMIALAQVLVKYALLEPFGVDTALSEFQFAMLVLSTVCLAAAGNVINDIYDVETDRVNRPDKLIIDKTISEKTAYNLFFIFNIVGVGLGFYVANTIGKDVFFGIFVLVSATLYMYATYLKPMLLVGNVVVSVLVGFSLLIVGLFDLLPAITKFNQSTQFTMFKIVFDYAVFAFIINFLREIIKDIEDADGDHKAGMNTLPIALGRDRATKIAFGVSFVPLLAVIYYVVTYLYHQPIAVVYFLLLVLAPLIYITIKLFTAESKAQFHTLGNVLKIVMLLGMLSMLLYPFILLE